MKKLIFILILIAAAFAVYWFMFRSEDIPEGPKQQALTVKEHSASFNRSIDSLLQSYFAIKNAFVKNDSFKAKQSGMAMVAFINRINLDELKKDTTGIFESANAFIGDVKINAESMGQSQTIRDMRQDFKAVSENIYPLLKTIHYEGSKLFWRNCPTAFGEGMDANWISDAVEEENPYLGKGHLDCGNIKDTIKAQ